MNSLGNKKVLIYDKGKAMRHLESFPDNCRFAFEKSVKDFGKAEIGVNFRKLVFFGMGGSGISGNIIKGLFPDREIHVIKDYNLPGFVNHDYFCIAISYSGNTEEAISCLEEAKRRGIKTLAVFSGGKMAEMAVPKGSFSINVPSGIVPRLTLDHMLFSALGFLYAVKIIDIGNDAEDAFKTLEMLRENLKFSCNEKNSAKDIAKEIKGKIPVIYGFGQYSAVSARAKEQFNENAKVPAFFELMPNADHNAIAAWEDKRLNKNLAFIIIRDENAKAPEMKARLEITIGILKRTTASVIEIRPLGKSALAKILSLIYIFDYTSFYLALLYKRDPMDTAAIEGLKAELRKEIKQQ